jgi:hypothetical protein
MNLKATLGAAGVLVLLSGCATMDLSNIVDTSAGIEDEEFPVPPNPEPGACYGKEVAPAVIQTETHHVVTRAATYDAQGKLVTPAAYRTETRTTIVRDREDIWFKVPCPTDRVEDFTASVQRALKARGFYAGRITGAMDAKTRRAVRAFQLTLGLDSERLSLDAARKLGLVAVPRS